MRTLVIGGGKIGYYLIKTLTDARHEVVLVDNDRKNCRKISEDLNVEVIWGDGTNIEILREAGIEEADIVVAVTGTDEENLIICQIAKVCFQTPKTISRVSNPKNKEIFKQLGIDNAVCSTEVISNLIEFSLENENYRVINVLEKGLMVLAELYIHKGIDWVGKYIRDLKLPEECVIVSVVRGETVIYPRGDTKILDLDKVIIITNRETLKKYAKKLYHGGLL